MPFEKAKNQRPSEFQAVVLAGYADSNSLYPISGEHILPKALLPVGNKAIILYTLEWLERAGILDVIIVLQSTGSAPNELRAYLVKNYSGSVHYTLEAVDENDGTADALRKIKPKINRDFIVLPCDLITDLDPRILLDMHRVQDSTMTALFYEAKPTDEERQAYVGIDPSHNALVYKADFSDINDFSMRMSLLNKFPRVRIHTDLQDAHLYIFKKWVLDFIADKERICSISQDLIPLLVKCQYQKKLVELEDVGKYKAEDDDHLLQRALSLSTTVSDDIDENLLAPDSLKPDFKSPVKTQVYVYREGLCCRGNTIAKYSELNRHMTKQGKHSTRTPPTAEVAPKTQVGNDSMIGEYTKIDERSSVKLSCVGAHCVIGKGVKIVNSVIMDHVVIGDNAKVDGCVISHQVQILEKANLKDCSVAAKYRVEKERQCKGEMLAELARTGDGVI